MYFDLSHPLEETPLDSVTHKQREAMALSLGYNRMAVITRTISSGQVSSSDKCPNVENKHLTRLNIVMSDTLPPGPMLASVMQSYDLVAIIPKSERTMQQACTSLDCDLICLELNQRLTFKIKPNLLSAAVKRGVRFEILYSGLLRDPTSRRHLINNSQALTRLLRGRNLIISSGARNAFELRGPTDVLALATELFGFESKEKAKMAITQGPNDAIEKGLVRKEGQTTNDSEIKLVEVQMDRDMIESGGKRKRA